MRQAPDAPRRPRPCTARFHHQETRPNHEQENYPPAHLLGRRQQRRRRQIHDDDGHARLPHRAWRPRRAHRDRHVQPRRVERAYQGLVPSGLFDLDRAEGWIDFMNTCVAQRDRMVAAVTAARNNNAVRRHGETLNASLDDLGAKLLTLWVINRQRDGLELLEEFIEAVPKAHVHVVRNGHFGDARLFEPFNRSKLRETIEQRGGKSFLLPDLADRVADEIYCQRLPISTAAKTLPIGNRAELARWRGEVRNLFLELEG